MSKKNIHKICENVQEKLQKSNASKSEVKITPQILRTSEVSSDAKNTVSQLSDSSLNVTKKPLSPIPDSDNIRSELKKQIYDLAAKNRHILLVGPIGIGKSHILRNLRLGTKTLFIDDLYDLKSTLVNWMMIIHNNDKKAAQEDLEDSADTPSVKYLQRTSITHLLRTILENIKNERYTIIIDSIDSVTPRAIQFLDIIKSRCNIIAAARQLPKSKDSLLWNFDVVEVGPLSKEESYSLMEKQIAAIGSIMNLEKDIKEKVYSSAGGNPRIMIELLNRLSQDQSPAAIANDLNNLTQIGFKQEKSIMPFLLVVVILLLPLRYISNITENSTQRTIGTIALVFFLVFRYLMRYLKG
jgi:chromosomal replication initiation ATPase DnaA